MADYTSPSKIPKINHPEADAIHDRLQLLAYKCHDPTVNPRETGQQLCGLATDVMNIMARWQKQKMGLQQTVQSLRGELYTTKRKLSEALGSAELLAATKDFCKDDLNHMATQTDSPSVENAEMQSLEKDLCKDDLHNLNDTTQTLPLEDDTQIDSPSVENAHMQSSIKDLCKDDLHDTTQSSPVEDEDA